MEDRGVVERKTFDLITGAKTRSFSSNFVINVAGRGDGATHGFYQ